MSKFHLGDVALVETQFRSEIALDEQMKRAFEWACPICYSNSSNSDNDNNKRHACSRVFLHSKKRGEKSLKLHLLLHRFEVLRRHVMLQAIQTEERILRKRWNEYFEAEMLLLLHRAESGLLLLRHHALGMARVAAMAEITDREAEAERLIFSEEWLESVGALFTRETLLRVAFDETRSRECIVAACFLDAHWSYCFERSPTVHRPFHVALYAHPSLSSYESLSVGLRYFDFFPSDSSSTSSSPSADRSPSSSVMSTSSFFAASHSSNRERLAGHLCRFQTLASLFTQRFMDENYGICVEDARSGPAAELLPRGINRFNIEQLLADEGMEDETSFLPVPLAGMAASIMAAASASAHRYGSASGFLDEMDRAEFLGARQQLKRHVGKLAAMETHSRRRLSELETERRERLFISLRNLYGIAGADRTAHSPLWVDNPRLSVQLLHLGESETQQRANLVEVEKLEIRRLSRLWQDVAMPGLAPPPSFFVFSSKSRQQQQQQQNNAMTASTPFVPASATAARAAANFPVAQPLQSGDAPATNKEARRSSLVSSGSDHHIVAVAHHRISPHRRRSTIALTEEEASKRSKEEALRQMVQIYGEPPISAVAEQAEQMICFVRTMRISLEEKLARYNTLLLGPAGAAAAATAAASSAGDASKRQLRRQPAPPPRSSAAALAVANAFIRFVSPAAAAKKKSPSPAPLISGDKRDAPLRPESQQQQQPQQQSLRRKSAVTILPSPPSSPVIVSLERPKARRLL